MYNVFYTEQVAIQIFATSVNTNFSSNKCGFTIFLHCTAITIFFVNNITFVLNKSVNVK